MNNVNDLKVDYFLNPTEIFKVEEDVKTLAFNKDGSILAYATKHSRIFIYDFISRCVIFEIDDFYNLELESKSNSNNSQFKLQITQLAWNEESTLLYCVFEKDYLNEDSIFIQQENDDINDIKQISNERNKQHKFGLHAFKFTYTFNRSLKQSSSKCSNEFKYYNSVSFLSSESSDKIHNISTLSNCSIIVNKRFLEKTNDYSTIKTPQINSLSNSCMERILVSGKSPFILDYCKSDIFRHEHQKEDQIFDEKNSQRYNLFTNTKLSSLPSIFSFNYTFLLNEIAQTYIDSSLNSNKIEEDQVEDNQIRSFNFNTQTFLLVVKELNMLMLIKFNKEVSSLIKNAKLVNSLDFKKLSSIQKEFYDILSKSLTNNFEIIFCYDYNFSSEVVQLTVDDSKSLVLVNCNDKVLRLFKVENNTITFFSDFFDPVNKRKWMNCYFYSVKQWRKNTFKERYNKLQIENETYFKQKNLPSTLITHDLTDFYNNISCDCGSYIKNVDTTNTSTINNFLSCEGSVVQDLVISALVDSSSTEFIILDLNTGVFIKKIEPFKYHVKDFVVHSNNYFSILLASSKKVFQIYGYYLNSWEGFAPHFSYIDNNIEYLEEEQFFDNEKKLELKLKKRKNELDICVEKVNSPSNDVVKDKENYLKNKILIKEIFRPRPRNNVFFEFNNHGVNDDLTTEKCQLQLTEIKEYAKQFNDTK